MELTANHITLRGSLLSMPLYSHENHGRRFFRFYLEVPRLSGAVDVLPVIAREDVLNAMELSDGEMLTVTGQNLVSPEEENEQLMLFDEAGRARRQRREQLEQTVDAIRQKYGRGAIHSAGLMDNDLGIALKDADEEEEEP